MVDRGGEKSPVLWDLIDWEISVRCLGKHPEAKTTTDDIPTGFDDTKRTTIEYHQHRVVYDKGRKGYMRLIRIDDIVKTVAPWDLKEYSHMDYVVLLLTIFVEQGKRVYFDYWFRNYPGGGDLIKKIKNNAEKNLAEWYTTNKVVGPISIAIKKNDDDLSDDDDDNEEHKAMIKNVNLILDQANYTQKRSDEELKRQRMELAELEKQPDRAIECVICMDRIPSISLIPCGHIFCKDCIDCLSKKECPTCKQLFQSTLKLYGLTK